MASNGFTEAQNLLLAQLGNGPDAAAVAAHFRAENFKLTATEHDELEQLCAEGETHEEQCLRASAQLTGDIRCGSRA